MVSQASGWANGRKLWEINHDGSEGPGQLEVSGEPPARSRSARLWRSSGPTGELFEVLAE